MPETLHLDASRSEDILRAAGLLREGRLVAFATETVYGLGADATSAEAVAGIFAAKERPHWDPLIVHLATASDAGADHPHRCRSWRAACGTLAERFWPGPLTLLLPRTPVIPDAVTAGRHLVGVRVPAHPAARLLLAASRCSRGRAEREPLWPHQSDDGSACAGGPRRPYRRGAGCRPLPHRDRVHRARSDANADGDLSAGSGERNPDGRSDGGSGDRL